jgi:hypothetical protein
MGAHPRSITIALPHAITREPRFVPSAALCERRTLRTSHTAHAMRSAGRPIRFLACEMLACRSIDPHVRGAFGVGRVTRIV